ncbi:LOW QUALITY PROTEIN: uncharacterized protein KIAA0040 homolog [Aplochiton taeniatus]
MADAEDSLLGFLRQLWSVAVTKHEQGLYNSVCLAVLLALPALVLLAALAVGCHCCCCRRANRRCCRQGGGGGRAAVGRGKKKRGAEKDEDLWISVKEGPVTADRVALTVA